MKWMLLFCIPFLIPTALLTQELRRPARPWDTCIWVEGKGGECGPSTAPKPFLEFLDPSKIAALDDYFSGQFRFLLDQPGKAAQASWQELGGLGTHRIRSVHFSRGGNPIGDLILAEGSRGIFSPLLKWIGAMPDSTIYKVGGVSVLVAQKNLGGNIPMVNTWAWTWSPLGPLRLDVDAAVEQAIQKLAPGHHGYQTGLDWRELHCLTSTWQGVFPGKIAVDETLEAWFGLQGSALVVKRVVLKKGNVETHWPPG